MCFEEYNKENSHLKWTCGIQSNYQPRTCPKQEANLPDNYVGHGTYTESVQGLALLINHFYHQNLRLITQSPDFSTTLITTSRSAC